MHRLQIPIKRHRRVKVIKDRGTRQITPDCAAVFPNKISMIDASPDSEEDKENVITQYHGGTSDAVV
jgi:plasmid maintenance system killer protein